MVGNVPMVTLWPEAKSEDVTSSGLPTPPTSHWQGLLPLPTPTRTLRLCTDTNKQGKKPLSTVLQRKKKSDLQTVTAELCFLENYHKLIHQYLALGTKSIECPTKFLFFYYLLPNQQAATTACPSGPDSPDLCPSHQSQGGVGWISFLTAPLH